MFSATLGEGGTLPPSELAPSASEQLTRWVLNRLLAVTQHGRAQPDRREPDPGE